MSSAIEGASSCKVYVAPTDILSCQHTMLRVTSFVAEALPPPELNPVHMRVHVTLREVIQDSLKGLPPQHGRAASSAPSYEVCPRSLRYADEGSKGLGCLPSRFTHARCVMHALAMSRVTATL